MIDIYDNISQMVQEGDDKKVVDLIKDALAKGLPAKNILEEGLVPGLQALGRLFKDGEAYLPEILIAIRAMERGVEELQPHLSGLDIHKSGTVVLGTVEGDLHDIGKDLVGMMLGNSGFNVIDLGIDISADTFIKAVKEHKPDIVAMSALLTTTTTYFSEVIAALDKSGLRDKVMVMVGGASVDRKHADEIGAEGYAADCVLAVDEAMRLMAMNK